MKSDKLSNQPVDRGIIHKAEGDEPKYLGSYISFDGNSCAVLSNSFKQFPNTIEVWFRTSYFMTQPIMDNYRNVRVEPNPYRLQVTDEGKILYYEMNADLPFSLITKHSYCDSKWYRIAVTRQYNNSLGELTITLYIFDQNGGVLEKCSSTLALCERKLKNYLENGYFTNMTPSYLGTDWFHENYMQGDIGEILLWSSALSEKELIERHNLKVKLPNIIYHLCYYKMSQGTFACDTINGALTAKLMKSWIKEISFYKGDYSIIILPDPQRLVKYYPEQVNEMFAWIAENSDELGIKLVLSVGDMVNDKTDEQYNVISNAAKQIYGKVPFLIIDGNHDYEGGNRELKLYKKAFDTATWRNQTGYTESYEEGSMSNSYYTYNFGGDKYIFLMLELAPRDEVITWSNKILKKYSDHRAIITTHAHLDVSGTYLNIDDYNTFYASRRVKDSNTDAKKLWEELISLHKNIQFIFSGHMGCCDIVWRADHGVIGNTIYTFCIDAEKMDSDFGGVGALARFSFTDSGKKIGVNYYSVSKNQLIGQKNQFQLTLDAPISYTGCRAMKNNMLQLTMAVGSEKYSEIGFDASICNLDDGTTIDYTVIGTELQHKPIIIPSDHSVSINTQDFDKEYVAMFPISLPSSNCLIILFPYCLSDGIRLDGQAVIITLVDGKINQTRFTGGEK